MKTEHMEYILEIARCGSISTAAKNLFINQTTLSAIVRGVELELGFPLFERSYNGIRQTPDAERVLSIMDETLSQFRKIQAGEVPLERKTIHLVSYGSVNVAISTFLSERFQNRKTRLFIDEVDYLNVVKQLVEGNAKIGIGADLRDAPVGTAEAARYGYMTETLSSDRYYLVVRSDSPYAQRESVNIADLLHEHLATAHSYPIYFNAPYNQVLRGFNNFTVFPSNEIIKKAVYKNGIIAIMLGLSLYEDILFEKGLLKKIPILDLGTEIVNFLVWDPTAQMSRAELELLDSIREFFSAPEISGQTY